MGSSFDIFSCFLIKAKCLNRSQITSDEIHSNILPLKKKSRGTYMYKLLIDFFQGMVIFSVVVTGCHESLA